LHFHMAVLSPHQIIDPVLNLPFQEFLVIELL
jgi:hypothetical protein